MKKLAVFALVLVAAVALASTAYSNNAALVIKDGLCGMLTGTGGIVITTESLTVVTQSQNGNTLLKCRAKGVANPTGKALNFDSQNNPLFPGLVCGTAGGVSTDWHQTISASGVATLTCPVP